MDRPTLHKILTSLTIVQAELEMTAGVLFEEGYRSLTPSLDKACETINVVRLSLIKHRRAEKENG